MPRAASMVPAARTPQLAADMPDLAEFDYIRGRENSRACVLRRGPLKLNIGEARDHLRNVRSCLR